MSIEELAEHCCCVPLTQILLTQCDLTLAKSEIVIRRQYPTLTDNRSKRLNSTQAA